jgi:hypothetical protein
LEPLRRPNPWCRVAACRPRQRPRSSHDDDARIWYRSRGPALGPWSPIARNPRSLARHPDIGRLKR